MCIAIIEFVASVNEDNNFIHKNLSVRHRNQYIIQIGAGGHLGEKSSLQLVTLKLQTTVHAPRLDDTVFVRVPSRLDICYTEFAKDPFYA